jgi:glucosylceramidase
MRLRLLTVCALVATLAFTAAATRPRVVANASTLLQTFTGVGAAITHSTAHLLQSAAMEDAEASIQQLFGANPPNANSTFPGIGGGMNVLRLPIGTSDFAVTEFFSLDDTPDNQDDWALSHFSLRKDEDYFIPAVQRVVQAIVASGRTPFIVACPWSAPAWMKDSKTLLGGTLRNDTRIIPTYARYFAQYVWQMKETYNITINALSMQNEPMNSQSSYPTMFLWPDQEAALVQAVSHELDLLGLDDVAILLWEHNWNDRWYPADVFGNLTTTFGQSIPARVTGVSFHCYEGSVTEQSAVRAAAPAGHQDVYFTECSSIYSSHNFGGDLMWDMQNLIIGAIGNWAKTVLKWNAVLDNTGGPKINGGCMNCRPLISISGENGTVTLQEDYYALAHVGSFVTPGQSNRVALVEDTTGGLSLTFQTPLGNPTTILINPNSTASVEIDACFLQLGTATWCATVPLPPQSVATIVFPNVGPLEQQWAASARSNGRGGDAPTADWWLTEGQGTKRLEAMTPLMLFRG